LANRAAGLSENPASTDELVRDLEDSGYPVDGSREQFIGNQTVYRRRQADLQPLRWNSTSAARRELARPQATTEGRPVAT
jgi:hypothetical protein